MKLIKLTAKYKNGYLYTAPMYVVTSE